MTRLPTPGSDDGTWGNVLNDFLDVEHNTDGTLRNVVRKNTLAVNITDYGAIGDDVADDTSAIQAAIAALPAGGGLVYFPPGTYKITSAITVRSALTLKGAGSSASVIHQHATGQHGFNGVDIMYLTVDGLRVVGPSSGSGDGLHLTRSGNAATNYIRLVDSVFRTWGGHGVSISNAIVSTFSQVRCENNGGHGFNLFGVSGIAGTSIALTGCYANANTQSGYHFDTMAYCSLSGCASEANSIDYETINCQSIAFTGCGSENNAGVGWRISGGYGIGIYTCWLYLNNGVGVQISGNAVAATIIGLVDNTPNAGATACVSVGSGSKAAIFNVHNTTANSLAVGTTQVFNDSSGGSVFNGALYLQSDLSVSGNAAFLGNANLSGELDIGVDTNLYRVAANNLATDDAFTVGGNFHTYANAQVDGNLRLSGNLGVGNAVAASTPGSITKKVEIFDANGTSLGYIPVYSSIS
jgi:hypothetical protein